MYDCIIIGMGVSGMGASIYAKRLGLKTLLIDENAPGGLLNKVSIVENYLGFKSITGPELASNMFEHVLNENVEYKIERVLKIEEHDDYKTIITTKNKYDTKGIIISIGRKLKKTGIPGEDKFNGKGISYCAICDAPLYKGKNVAVLGGGNSAFEESLYLKKYASNVTIYVRNKISADETLVNECKNNNINIVIGKSAKEFIGDNYLEKIKFDDEIIDCDGVFIYYGYMADTAFLSNLNITDERGYILVDSHMKTSINNIYACGDIIKKDLYQIITGVSEGAIAAYNLNKDIKGEKNVI